MGPKLKTRRSTISRREPVIALTSFRYRGRNYEEGGYLDRRRTRMPHSRLVSFIREGKVQLAKDLDPETLLGYGFRYAAREPRNKLKSIAREEALRRRNQALIEAAMAEEEETESPGPEAPVAASGEPEATSEPAHEVRHTGGGWYDVFVGGMQVNDRAMRKEEAMAFRMQPGDDLLQ